MAGILEEILNMQTPKQFTNNLGVENPIQNAKTDDKFDQIRNAGYTEDQIQNAKTGPVPGQSTLEFYTKVFQKPDPIDEKQIRNAKLYAGIGDTLSLLSQMFSSREGAHIRNRDYNQSALSKNDKEEKDLRALYRKSLDDYNKGAYNAVLNNLRSADRINQNQARTADRENQRNWRSEENKRQNEARENIFNLKWERENDPNSEKNKYRKESLENQKKRTGIAATSAQIRANNQVLQDEKNRVFGEAIADVNFQRNHPELFVEETYKDAIGRQITTGKFKMRSNAGIKDAIVQARLRETNSNQNSTKLKKNAITSNSSSNGKKKAF